MKKLSYKYYNNAITTHDNDNVQSHDKEESKLNSTITANSATHTLTHTHKLTHAYTYTYTLTHAHTLTYYSVKTTMSYLIF